jgi:hypothetical protein
MQRKTFGPILMTISLLGAVTDAECRDGPGWLDGRSSAELTVIGAEVDGAQALVFRVPYQPGSERVDMSRRAERTLMAFASGAKKVAVEAGAEGARAARKFLVERGVPANRIEISAPAAEERHLDIVTVLPAAGAMDSSGGSE